jgi:hypothetical protein
VSTRMMVSLSAAAMWAVCGFAAGTVYADSGPQVAEKFVLSGLIYVEGGHGLAWLQEPTFTNNKIVVVRVGDAVGPYRLTKILDDQVELEGPGGKVSVPLAGTGGAVSVVAIPGTAGLPRGDVVSGQPVKHIVVERGDPSRNFPVADLLIGGGAQLTGKVPAQQEPTVKATDRGIVPASMQVAPPVSPDAAAQVPMPVVAVGQSPVHIVIPRGDPRREFPASSLLLGAGAQTSR